MLVGLANGDPDVDAIFRLTRRYRPRIELDFDSLAAPIALPSGVLAPYNSQNTLIHYDAFWSLLLPHTTTFRVCDIWRGYWAQRLLWEIGAQLLFRPPSVYQSRNVHSYIRDFIEEMDLYRDAGRLVRFLLSWRKPNHLPFFAVVLSLSYDMAKEGFWEFGDVDLTLAWLLDLQRIGYRPPLLSTYPYSSDELLSMHGHCHPHQPTTMDLFREHLEEDSRMLWDRLANEYERVRHVAMETEKTIRPSPHAISDPSIQTIKALRRPLRFWSVDFHDGTRIDHPTFLVARGHTVVNGGDKRDRSPYPDAIRQLEMVQRAGPPVTHVAHQMSEQDVKENFEFYKKDPQMMATDAYICGFHPGLCEYWAPFNRTIVFIPAHRFNLMRCSRARLKRVIEHVQFWAGPPLPGAPRHVVAAGSVYDQEYMWYWTGVWPVLLSSNSFWYAGNRTIWQKTPRPEILVAPLQRRHVLFHSEMLQAVERYKSQSSKNRNVTLQFAAAKELYRYVFDTGCLLLIRTVRFPILLVYFRCSSSSHYALQDIANHRAAILFPYAVMSYGITELYALNIPLFIPTVEFLLSLRTMDDFQYVAVHYCGNMKDQDLPHPLLNSTQHQKHPYSPESPDAAAKLHWLRYADFYQWPHITQFGSWDELILRLTTTNLQAIHDKMVAANHWRAQEFIYNWEHFVFPVIDDGPPRMIPQNYTEAIQQLTGFPQWMAD